MLWKLLLTAAVILGAYLVVRPARGVATVTAPPPARRVLRPHGLVRGLAYALLGLGLGGVAFYLVNAWDSSREVLQVQVINANTGAATHYRARRRDIEGRGFRTLEGQVVLLADVERMVLTSASSGPEP